MNFDFVKKIVIIASGLAAASTTRNVIANNTTPTNGLQSAVYWVGAAAVGVTVARGVEAALSDEIDETREQLQARK